MAKLTYAPGDTSKQVEVYLRDTSVTSSNTGKTGLVFNTAGLVCSYSREDDGNAGSTSVSLVTATRGTWTSGGFVEKDSTKQPGVYIFSVPNAALAAASKWVTFTFQGATGIEQVNLELELDPAASSSASAAPTTHSHVIKQGTTSKRIEVFIRDTSSTSGAGLTGLVFNSASLTWYRTREDDGNAGATSVTLATATLGTWSTGGFKEKDSTHYPGWYELGIPDNVLASAATWATMTLKGAANMAPCIVNIFLVAVDFNDGTRFGMTGLPNGPMTIKKNAGETVPVAMFSSSTRQMQSGLTVSCTISQDGGMPAATSNAVTEVAGGEYKVVLTTTETNCNSIFLKFTASGADDLPMLFYTQP